MRLHRLGLLLFVVGCSGAMDAAESGDDQGPSDPNGGAGSGSGSGGGGGGHGVSFGGAQDIGQFRAALDRGELPTPEMFDPNGFFNEHFNPPPQIGCGGILCLTPGLAVGTDWVDGKHQAALQVSLATYVDPTTYHRLPMKLVVVVDHSGSMASDDRLVKVKGGLHTLVDSLHDEDRLAIISFDDVVTYDAAFPAESAALNRAALHATIDTLQPRGGTNIYEGLRAGLAMLGETPSNERQNRVIFLSDGLATVGNTSQTDIVDMSLDYIRKGIGLTTIGVGNDFDVLLMRGLAEQGAGNFYFVEDAAAANEVFTDELDYFMQPLALDIQVKASTSTGWDFTHVYGTPMWTASAHEGGMKVPAVFLASRVDQQPDPNGGRRGGGSMLFLSLNPTAHDAGDVANLELSYRLPGQTERSVQSVKLDYARDPQEMLETPYISYPGMAERYAMYNMYLAMAKATKLAAFGSPSCAAAVMQRGRNSAAEWSATHEEDLDMTADIALADKFLAVLASHGGTTEVDLATCPNVDDQPLPEDGQPWGDEWEGDDIDDVQYGFGCTAAKQTSSAGGMLLLGAVALIVRRRRK